jgi:hypothetical protein
MISRFALVIAVAAGVCGSALPAAAEEVGVGIGPGGVTVGPDHDRDRDRDHKTVIIKKDHDGDRDKTVVIKKDHDRD